MRGRSAVPSAVPFHGSIPGPGCAPRREGGFTFVEIVIAFMIVGLLAMIAVPSYLRLLEKDKETQAISDIKTIAKRLQEYGMEFPQPSSLATVNVAPPLLPLIDPWGHPYMYLPLQGLTPNEAKAAGARKNKNDFPITTDFDLYSMGPDGETHQNLQNLKSRDDLVRADEGAFVGKASTYDP